MATHPDVPSNQPERDLDAGTITDGAPSPGADFGMGQDLAGPHSSSDLAMPQGVADLSMPSGAVDLSMPVVNACVPRINEVMTGDPSASTDEFVEIYNPCASAVDLSNWKLVYRAATNVSTADGVDSSTLFAFAAGTQIASQQFLVYAGSSFTGSKTGALAASLKDGAGAVGLRNGAGALVDSLGYGSVDTSNAFVRVSAAPAPPVVAGGGSIGRMPDGSNSDNNSTDFKVSGKITPGAANQ